MAPNGRGSVGAWEGRGKEKRKKRRNYCILSPHDLTRAGYAESTTSGMLAGNLDAGATGENLKRMMHQNPGFQTRFARITNLPTMHPTP